MVGVAFMTLSIAGILTIENLRRWVADGIDFVVMDLETGADVTRVLLA
jgi:polyhydroxyalkanoate synthesis regulator protein